MSIPKERADFDAETDLEANENETSQRELKFAIREIIRLLRKIANE